MLMLGKQLTEEQRLQKAVIDIMACETYYAVTPILMIGKKSICDKTPTAYTNGRDEVYGRKFVEGLNDAELRFLVLHETYHKLYQHLTTWQHLYKENARAANMACDYVINVKLLDGDNKMGFIAIPKSGGLYDEKYRGMDSAQVYHLLMQDAKEDERSGGGGGGGAGDGQPMDDHGWEEAQSLSDEERRELSREIDDALRQGVL